MKTGKRFMRDWFTVWREIGQGDDYDSSFVRVGHFRCRVSEADRTTNGGEGREESPDIKLFSKTEVKVGDYVAVGNHRDAVPVYESRTVTNVKKPSNLRGSRDYIIYVV